MKLIMGGLTWSERGRTVPFRELMAYLITNGFDAAGSEFWFVRVKSSAV
jgi:hypothetical protein